MHAGSMRCLHSGEPGRRPIVLCVVDRPHWAHDRKTDALARVFGGAYETGSKSSG